MLSMECNPEPQRVFDQDAPLQHSNDTVNSSTMERTHSVEYSMTQDSLSSSSSSLLATTTTATTTAQEERIQVQAQCKHPEQMMPPMQSNETVRFKKRLSSEMESSTSCSESSVQERRQQKRIKVEEPKLEKDALQPPLSYNVPSPTPTKPQSQQVPTTSSLISLQLEIASEILPHPKKAKWGGEDALFTHGRTFGVFDGVSGAKKIKGMPLYSKTLAMTLQRTCRTHDEEQRHDEPITVETWKEWLWNAAKYIRDRATGSTTAVVASIGQDNILRVVNMGDSALVVIRNGKIIARTVDTGKSFNVPCQLPFCSPRLDSNTSDLTEELFPGDWIVAGSDGVFDNLSEESICAIVEHHCSSDGFNGTASQIAKAIIQKTHDISKDKLAPTPIAKVYKEMGKGNGFGGKKDDMCCVVVRCKSAKNGIK